MRQSIPMTNLQFPRGEYDRRLNAAVSALDQQGLHGVVLFRQESMYYLSGYDTSWLHDVSGHVPWC